jgi:hypothetical protein
VVRTVGRTAVVAGTATAVAGGVSKRQTNKQIAQQEEDAAAQQAAYDQGAADAQPARPPAAPAPAGNDTMAELQRLGDMKSQGLLTDEEFSAAKAKLLGS